jgi:hypothetical protein
MEFRRKVPLVVIAMFLILVAGGCKSAPQAEKADASAAANPAQPRKISDYKPGEVVEALHEGKWKPAVITSVAQRHAQVHFIGYTCGLDEWMVEDELRAGKHYPPYPDSADPKNLHTAYSPHAYPEAPKAK